MKRSFTLAIALVLALSTFAQKEVKLSINHLMGSADFAFNTEAQNDLGHKFKLNRLEYYISGISITHDGGKETLASGIYILAQANRNDTFSLGSYDITNIESISFSVGVDPFVNNEDPAAWASDHALSPKSPSMHWGWASGYRFVAIEGKSGSGLNQDFQIHALGNKNYFKQNIPVDASDLNGALFVELNADYQKAISGISIDGGLVEHSEDNQAAVCLRNFQMKVFSNLTGEGNTLSVKNASIDAGFKIYPNPTSGVVNIQLQDLNLENVDLTVYNLLGETVAEFKASQTTINLNLDTPGVYFIRMSKNGFTSSKKIVVQ